MRFILGLLLAFQLSFSTEVIGFMTNYGFSSYYPSAAELARLTQINLFPFQPSSSGTLSSPWGCSTVTSLKNAQKKVYFTIGGASYSANFDPAITYHLSSFVSNIVAKMKECGFDGVDIDWEYPNDNNQGQATKFKNFIAALRTAIDNDPQTVGKKISIDVPTQWLDALWGEEPFEVGSSVYTNADYINVMNYDDYKTASKPNHSGWVKMHENMSFWKERVPSSKLVLGVPFYGRPNDNSENTMYYSSMWPAHDSIDVYNGYYYNGPEMMYDKALYARTSGFHGVMYWAMNSGGTGMDKSASSSNSLLYQIHKALTDPAPSSGGNGMPAFEPEKTFDNTIILHDGKYWRQKFGGFKNFPPYSAGSDQVDFVWESNTEPWCDTWYKWQSVCTYSDEKFVEVEDKCYQLNEGVTSTAGVTPGSSQGQTEWTEEACTPCETIDYGEEWSLYCVYRPGEVVSYNGYLWEAIDNTSLGVDSVPANTRPTSGNAAWWLQLGEVSSSVDPSSSSSNPSSLLFSDVNPLFEMNAHELGLQWTGLEVGFSQVHLVNSTGQLLHIQDLHTASGEISWSQSLSSGVYHIRFESAGTTWVQVLRIP